MIKRPLRTSKLIGLFFLTLSVQVGQLSFCVMAQEDESSAASATVGSVIPFISDAGGAVETLSDPFVLPEGLQRVIEERAAALAASRIVPEAPEVVEEVIPEEEPLPPPELPKMSLTGVIYNVDKPAAIINGQVFDQGDALLLPGDGGTIHILSVGAGEVKLLYMGVEHTITIDEQGDPNSGQ